MKWRYHNEPGVKEKQRKHSLKYMKKLNADPIKKKKLSEKQKGYSKTWLEKLKRTDPTKYDALIERQKEQTRVRLLLIKADPILHAKYIKRMRKNRILREQKKALR